MLISRMKLVRLESDDRLQLRRQRVWLLAQTIEVPVNATLGLVSLVIMSSLDDELRSKVNFLKCRSIFMTQVIL